MRASVRTCVCVREREREGGDGERERERERELRNLLHKDSDFRQFFFLQSVPANLHSMPIGYK